MVPRENSSRSVNNVTDLNEVRQSKAREKAEAEAAKNAETNVGETKDHGNRRFDKEKVDRLKAEIASGQYVIDPNRIANKFIEHERNQ